MDVLRKYLWVFLICGIFFVSVVITIIFLFINKCISRAGNHRIAALQRGSVSNVESNSYQERTLRSITPPLPPRTQFLIQESQSYENLAEQLDTDVYEEPEPEPEPEYEQALDEQMVYVEMEDELDLLPPPSPPPYHQPDAADDDYDDIGGEDEDQDEEDYDDVG